MTRLLASLVVALFFAAVGCSASSNAHGQASYVESPDAGGEPVPPQEEPDDMQVSLTIGAQADFAALDAALCSLTSGNITGAFTSKGQVDSNGQYHSEFDANASSSGSFTSPLCGALRNVKLSSVTSLTVNASVPANETNCEAYCEASAKKQCDSDQACHTNAKANCKGECSGASRITGSGSMSSSSMSEVNSDLAGGSGTVDAEVDLVFDRLQ